MRQYLFRGIRVDTRRWIEGGIYHQKSNEVKGEAFYIIGGSLNDVGCAYQVVPRSIGQYTGMNEFVLTDETRNAKLFEGDIVEVWGHRHVRGYNKSQYDGRVKVRGVIVFKHGEWCIDYENNYNLSLAKLKGTEVDDREVSGSPALYYYGYHGSNIDEYRKERLEWHEKFHNIDAIRDYDDIVKIGNVFDNSELLEG